MEKIRVRNIVIAPTIFNQAIYRCEFRELENTRNFVTQIDRKHQSMYIREESDHKEMEAKTIHTVYSEENNYTTYFSTLEDLEWLNDNNGQPVVQALNTSEIRIYAPQNYVQDDMLIVASTYINGRYVQLFGGLYSECKFNSYEVIKDNQNTYMEYIYFYVSTELIENLPYNSISLCLIPYTDLVNGTYKVHDEYLPDGVTFEANHYLNLSAKFENREGMAGISVVSNMTKREFQNYYKNLYYDKIWTMNDSYKCIIELYDNTKFTDEHLLWRHNHNQESIKLGTEDGSEGSRNYFSGLLIDKFYPFDKELRFFFNQTLNKKLKVTSTEQAQWLQEYYSTVTDSESDISYFGEENVGRDWFELTWDYIPDIIYGIAYIDYTCVNRLGHSDVRRFYTNRFVITKDRLKYIINKPDYKVIPKKIFDDYKDKMLNINITNVIEEKIPDKVLLAQNSNLIYKPVFFKTQQMSSLELVPGVTQRVGLNLQDYETKVSTFRLKIGVQVFIETERTDQYVIFKVDANLLDNTETQYHILDQDAQYITSGKLYFT